jgi:hypothetical protein
MVVERGCGVEIKPFEPFDIDMVEYSEIQIRDEREV